MKNQNILQSITATINYGKTNVKKDYNHAMFHLTRKESLSRFYWNLFTVNDSRISNKK